MTKVIVRKKVTAQQYQTALDAYRGNEVAAKALAAKRDTEVAKLDDKYNPLFEQYMEQQQSNFELVQQYCEENRDVLFEGRQMIKSNGVDYGFRKGKVRLALLDGQTEETVLEAVKENLPGYIRVKEEIAKDKLLADKDTITDKDLASAGLCLTQDEAFFIKVVESKKS